MIDLSRATPEELAAIEPADFVEGVKAMSGRELETLMTGPAGGPIIGSVFSRMPQIFVPERAAGATATSHWSITGLPGGGTDDWTVRVADGQCTVGRGLEGDATVGLTLGPVEFVKLITRTGNPMMMVVTGRLKATGDVALAARLGSWFEIPTR
ncbi:MAG: Sterol-binding domain protein [Humibacillus sp.]|nr:Sterol-binding domain protein [Humibacillus sp.]